MPGKSTLRRLRSALLAAACGLIISGVGGVPAIAQTLDNDDDGPTFEQKIIMGILGGIGVDVGNKPGIDYRERSPLVVPPSRNLPAPQNAAAVEQNPAWPRDPDQRRRRKESKQRDPSSRSVDRIEPAGGR